MNLVYQTLPISHQSGKEHRQFHFLLNWQRFISNIFSSIIFQEGETIFEEILENKFDVNNIEIIVEIFEEIFAPDYQFRNQSTPFHSIAEYGLMEPLIYCFKLGVSPNLPTSIGYTPFPSNSVII